MNTLVGKSALRVSADRDKTWHRSRDGQESFENRGYVGAPQQFLASPRGYHIVRYPTREENRTTNYNNGSGSVLGTPAAESNGPATINPGVDNDALAIGSMLAYRNPYLGIAPVIPLAAGVGAPAQTQIFGLEPIQGVPPGLEVLQDHGFFYIREHVDAFEFFAGYEMANRYSVYSPAGRIFLAGESSSFCNRYCCAEARSFALNVFDPTGRLLFYLERPCSLSIWCCGSGCNGSDVAVRLAGSGELIGSVNQNCSCSEPQFTITDPSGQVLMTIEGPSGGACCPCALFGDIAFNIYDLNRHPIGRIMKRFTIKEVSSDANDFGLVIPAEFDTRLKTVLLGAVFSIDFSFFESDAGAGRGKNAFRGPDYCPCCRGTIAAIFWSLVATFILGGIPAILIITNVIKLYDE